MIRFFALAGLGWLALCSGCATTLSLATDGPGTLRSPDGRSTVSEKQNVVALRVVTSKFSNRTPELPAVFITVTNRTSTQVPFALSAITVRSGEKPVRVYNGFDLLMRIRKDSAFDRFNARAQGAARTQIATMMWPAGKPVVVSQVETLQNERFAVWAEQRETNNLSQLLYPHDLRPGESLSGVVKLYAEDIVPMVPLVINVRLGEETHTFTLTVNG